MARATLILFCALCVYDTPLFFGKLVVHYEIVMNTTSSQSLPVPVVHLNGIDENEKNANNSMIINSARVSKTTAAVITIGTGIPTASSLPVSESDQALEESLAELRKVHMQARRCFYNNLTSEKAVGKLKAYNGAMKVSLTRSLRTRTAVFMITISSVIFLLLAILLFCVFRGAVYGMEMKMACMFLNVKHSYFSSYLLPNSHSAN